MRNHVSRVDILVIVRASEHDLVCGVFVLPCLQMHRYQIIQIDGSHHVHCEHPERVLPHILAAIGLQPLDPLTMIMTAGTVVERSTPSTLTTIFRSETGRDSHVQGHTSGRAKL
jgi:hypothetical protein